MEASVHTDAGAVPPLVVVGELNVDLLLEQVNALPALGKERLAQGMTLTLGSSSAILAANARALGLEVGFVGRVGRDAFGRFVLEHLAARGVETRHVIQTDEAPTGLTLIYTHQERRGMLTYPGVMTSLTLEDIPWDYLRQARHLHLSSYYLQTGLRPACATLFRRAREMGLTTSLDTNWDPDEVWGDDVLAVMPHVDIFLPNDEEARLISGEDDLDAAIERLAREVSTLVVKCGARGVRAVQEGRHVAMPAVPVEPVDAVGAGDSFNAGFLHAYLQGQPLETCLQQGLLTGAFSTLTAGGIQAFAEPARFEHFADEMRAHFDGRAAAGMTR